MTPNFLILEAGRQRISLPIDAYTDAELREIGRRWTADLVEKARIRRTDKPVLGAK